MIIDYMILRRATYAILSISLLAIGFFAVETANAGTVQMRVKNNTHTSYSSGTPPNNYSDTVRAEPGDELEFRMLFLGDSSASTITVDFPSGLTFVNNSTSVCSTCNVAGENNVDTDTIRWSFAPATTQIITFTATVANGSNLPTDHSLEMSFSNNGTPTTSDTATITTGPIVTSVSPSSAVNSAASKITITGHGFTGDGGDTVTEVRLDDNTILDLTGATISDTSIAGANLKVPALHAVGTYFVLVTVSADGTNLITATSTAETVQYQVTDGVPPTMSTGSNTYAHSTGALTLNFDETMDASQTNASKVTLADASSGGNSITLDNATISTADDTVLAFTLAQDDINTISTWGKTAGTLYVQLAGTGLFDISSNSLSAQGSRTALDTWTKDTTKPTVSAFTVTQGTNTSGSVKAGTATLSFTLSEPVSAFPLITITQQGTASTTNASLTAGANNSYSYVYTVVAADSSSYIDGAATAGITTAIDYAGNVMAASNQLFTIDTTAPAPAMSTLSASANTTSKLNLSWTASYTESDFGEYRVYYSQSTGVNSSTGTAITSASTGFTSLSSSGTASITITGLSANTNYYAVIYICDIAENCSAISNEANVKTSPQGAVSLASISSGGGGGGRSAPTTVSSAKSVTQDGGSFSTSLPSGSTTSVSVPANTFFQSTTITVSEATTAQKLNSALSSTIGSVIADSIVTIVANTAGSSVTSFSQPITISFTYTGTQLGSLDVATLRVAYFNETTGVWIPLPSSIDPVTGTVSAQTDHFTLFALISFIDLQDEITERAPVPPTVDSGQILGTAVGIYANGTLLKSPTNSAVWHIANNQKHLIRSATIFESQFLWNDIIELPSSLQLDAYEQGADVKFRAGTLVKMEGEPAVYRVSIAGGLQPILSEEIFLARGYQYSNMYEVESVLLSEYPIQSVIVDAERLYTGDIVMAQDTSNIYYIEADRARLIPNSNILKERAYDISMIRVISSQQFSSLTKGADLLYPDGTLVKGGSSAVYVISDGSRRPIKSGADFEALLYKWNNIIHVPESLLAQYPDSSLVRIVLLED
jgi:hypothetical protein